MVGCDRSTWTVRDIALRQLRDCGDRIFVQEVDGESESYRTFIGRSIALCHFLLGLGVKHGDTVAIFTRNGLPGLHAWLSTALIGAVEVPINPSYRSDILLHILTLAKPAVVVADNEVLPALVAIEKHLEFVRDIIVVDDTKSGSTATVTTSGSMTIPGSSPRRWRNRLLRSFVRGIRRPLCLRRERQAPLKASSCQTGKSACWRCKRSRRPAWMQMMSSTAYTRQIISPANSWGY